MKFLFFLLALAVPALCSAAESEVVALFLQQLDEQIDRIDDPAYYKNKTYIDKNTKEKIRFSDFSPAEQKIFYLWQAECLSKKLLAFEYQLQEVPSIVKRMQELRKKMAARHEALVEKTFAEIGDDIVPQNDKISHSKQVRKWNDQHSLIKR
jgi:hypothetical protein